jgi:ubiquinone/menaquinone biosynthesis C-methylase UbiE
MPDHQHIYQTEAEQYERLISSQPNLSEVVQAIVPYSGLDIIDLGAGTGRLSCVLAGKAKTIIAVDNSAAMLKVTAEKLQNAGCRNWQIQVADHRVIPAADQSADLIVSGWSLCYLTSSNVEGWQLNLQQIMLEIQRVLRPGGTVIIFENFGTGGEAPNPPDFLQGYYDALVQEYGFEHSWIRTDYQFADVEEAEQLARFFFGDEIADKAVNMYGAHLPECAGVWWRVF